MIYTGCFFKPKTHIGETVSIARYMPKNVKGLHCDKTLTFFQPSAQLLKEKPPWEKYWPRFFAEMKANEAEIRAWVESLDPFEDMTLCCWEKDESRCHRSLVGKILEKINPEIFGGEVLDDPVEAIEESIQQEIQQADKANKVVQQAAQSVARTFNGSIPEAINSEIKEGDLVYWVDKPQYLGFLTEALTVRSINPDGTLNCTWVGHSLDPSRLERKDVRDAREQEEAISNATKNKTS